MPYTLFPVFLYKQYPSIHPLSIPLIPWWGRGGNWSLSQWSTGERQGTPWTVRQSIAGPHTETHKDKQPHTLTFTPKGNLECPINLTCRFLDCGRKPENPERTHADTGRTCKLHPERSWFPRDYEPRTLLLGGDSANHHTTVPPFSAQSGKKYYLVHIHIWVWGFYLK